MKLHHFSLVFAVIAIGFFVTTQTVLVTKMQREGRKKTEYDCLVSAVGATVEEVFYGMDNRVSQETLRQAEEVFFQTLSVLRDGTADRAAWEKVRERVPCLVVFEKRGYYKYCLRGEEGYSWSGLVLYDQGDIPKGFFEETEELLEQYHNLQYRSDKSYRMELAGQGVWEQSIEPPCVFAIYAPEAIALPEDTTEFLYAASGREYEAYYVTKDNYCHLPFCEAYREEDVIARYATQRQSAEDGALPCEYCLK